MIRVNKFFTRSKNYLHKQVVNKTPQVKRLHTKALDVPLYAWAVALGSCKE